MTSILAGHYIPSHGRRGDLEYFNRIKAGSVKIVDPDVQLIADVHQACPQAVVVLRDHPLSEQHDDMARDPIGTGARHAERWQEKLAEYQQQASDRNLTIPASADMVCLGINEPRVWTDLHATVDYTVAFLNRCNQLNIKPGALNLSVGWPGNHGPDTPPDWAPYAPIEEPLKRSGGYLMLHEYWSDQYGSVEYGWGWWADRLRHCPWQGVSIIVGECGIDNGVSIPFEGSRGWLHHASPQEYAQQLLTYANKMKADGRVHSIQVFTTDYNKPWDTFDTEPAHDAIINTAFPSVGPVPGQVEIMPPAPELPPVIDPTPPILTEPGDIVWPAKGVLTQRWGEHYNIYMDKFGIPGHNGIDIAAEESTPILSIADGVVTYLSFDERYGNYVRVYHPTLGIHSFYAHLERPASTIMGAQVMAGDHIGLMGNTGFSTGPHLHFEIRNGGLDTYGYSHWGHTKGRIDPELFFYLRGNSWRG